MKRHRPVQHGTRALTFAIGLTLFVLTPPSMVAANAPSGRYTAANGTVYDTKTKLTWQQSVSTSSYLYSDASNYCATIGASLGGSGWRVPTIKELQTIVDYSQTAAPWIDRAAFPATPLHYFWSSTVQAGTTSSYWVFDFSAGVVTTPFMTNSCNVRCVR